MILFADQVATSEPLAPVIHGVSQWTSPEPPPAHPVTIATQVTPAEVMPTPWLAIDIETGQGRPEDVERNLRLHWDPPSTSVKAALDESRTEKQRDASLLSIANAFVKRVQAVTEKSALLDAAPIVVVSIRTPNALHALHCLRQETAATHAPTGGVTQGFATGREMLLALRTGLDAICTPETTLVGHNILSFDLPRLRWAYLRAGLRMPWALANDAQPVFDIMRVFGRRFTQTDRPFIALADVLNEFGMPNHKAEIDGSRVPEMVAEILAGDDLLPELLAYALQDALAEAEVFLRMTNQLPDQPTAVLSDPPAAAGTAGA